MKLFETHHTFFIIIILITFFLFFPLENKAQQAEQFFQSYSKAPYLNFTYYVNSANTFESSSLNCTLDTPCVNLHQVFTRLDIDLSNNINFLLYFVNRIVAVEIILMNDLLADCSSPPTILRSPLTGLFYWIKISGQPNQTKQVTVKCQVDNLNLLNVDRKDVDVLYFANIGIENVRIYDSYAKGFLLSNVKIVNLISVFTSLNLFILEYSNVYIFKFTANSIQLSRIDNSKILYFTMNILIGTKQDKLYISNIQSTQSFIINTEQSSLLSLYNSIFEETLAFFSISFADNILIENCTFSVAMKSDPVFVIANSGLVRVWKSRMLDRKSVV